MPKDAFISAMMQLCNPKVMVLKKAIRKPDFTKPNEAISINLGYNSKTVKNNLIPSSD